MPLFTDGNINRVDDLAAHDSGLLGVASSEGINLTNKINLAQDDLALELTGMLRSEDSLGSVVVTSALRLWHAFRTLEMVYRDAYANQLNDRYASKRDQFAQLAKSAADKLIQIGLGMVANPLPRAAFPQLTYYPGTQAGATYYVCVSWVDPAGDEGAAGDYTAITVPDNNVLSVRPVNPPAMAAGWNVFVGLSPDTIARQNQSPLPLSQVWLQQVPVSTAGKPPGAGQNAQYTRIIARILQRG
jgi:hypothetical protein